MPKIAIIGAGKNDSLNNYYQEGQRSSDLFRTTLNEGVIGLSTALNIQEKGHSVTIIGKHLPGDEKHIEYTSPWAVRT